MRSGSEDVRELTDLYWQRGQSNHPSKPASESNFRSSCTKGIYMYIYIYYISDKEAQDGF